VQEFATFVPSRTDEGQGLPATYPHDSAIYDGSFFL
jgi:hypothetical protein